MIEEKTKHSSHRRTLSLHYHSGALKARLRSSIESTQKRSKQREVRFYLSASLDQFCCKSCYIGRTCCSQGNSTKSKALYSTAAQEDRESTDVLTHQGRIFFNVLGFSSFFFENFQWAFFVVILFYKIKLIILKKVRLKSLVRSKS